jgi:hypothetical protein
MISLNELNSHNYPTTLVQSRNLLVLLHSLNIVRKEWNQPMIVTSGLRSPEDQLRINPSAPNSKHLTGEAADIQDIDGQLYKWLQSPSGNAIMVEASLYGEMGTRGWVHLQTKAPRSGNRWFLP